MLFAMHSSDRKYPWQRLAQQMSFLGLLPAVTPWRYSNRYCRINLEYSSRSRSSYCRFGCSNWCNCHDKSYEDLPDYYCIQSVWRQAQNSNSCLSKMIRNFYRSIFHKMYNLRLHQLYLDLRRYTI